MRDHATPTGPALACTICRRETDVLHQVACPSCVGQTRHLIRQILDLVPQAITEWERVGGIGSGAFMVAMPAANYEAAQHLHHSATAGRLCRCRTRGWEACVSDIYPDVVCPDAAFVLEEDRDELRHPSTVLQVHALHWRGLLDHTPPATPGVDTEARYLLQHLTRMAQREDADVATLKAEVGRCVDWLEQILRLGVQAEKGAGCPECRGPRLEKTVGDDVWRCPSKVCASEFDPDQYQRALHGRVLDSAEHLNARLMADRLGVPRSTIKRWAGRQKHTVKGRAVYRDPLLPAAGQDALGLTTYDVAAAEALASTLRKDATA